MRSSTNRRAPTGRPHGQAIGGRIGRRRPQALAFGVAVAVAAAMSAAATTAAAAPGRQAPSRSPVSLDPIVGAVYVDGNTAPTNSVAGYYRHADGSLTTIPGSPFAVGGAGTGRATASQGALQLSADGRYLLAVDAQSAQISVLRVRADGSLGSVDGSPFSSGGGNPVSIAVHDGLVYVANADANQPNYTGFTLDDRGQLTPIAGSTVSLPAGSQPGDVLFNGDGTKLVGTRVGTSLIDSFTVGGDGRLTAAAGSPFAAQAAGPFGSEFSPLDPGRLFVSNAHAGPGNGSVSSFSDAPDGTLTPFSPTPFADEQTAPCWVEITHDGRYLFTVNTAVSTISRYRIKPNGSLRLLGSTALSSPTGVALGPEDARLSPDGSTLFVVDSGGDAISAFAVSGGDLTELASSPTPGPAGVAPSGIVVNGG